MIASSLLSRTELKKMIENSPKTHDGYYFFPRFRALVQAKGKIKDNGYVYDRQIFHNKIIFSNDDLKMFVAKKRLKVDIDLMLLLDKKVNDVLEGLEYLDLKDKVFKQDYTLEELIDNCIYIFKYKYF